MSDGLVAVTITVLVIGVGSAMMAGCPKYNVYSSEMSGKAKLAEANQSRQILVTQALAEKESAVLRAQAIEIVGKATQQYPEYRQAEFIGAFGDALKDGKISQIIYVPTEANIPVLEATRMKESK